MKYADLHIHTKSSDGTFTPEAVIRQAHKEGLSCIAITDHDEVSAIGPALKEAEQFNIEVIPGVELSAEINGYEVHILGYFIDWQAEWFKDKLKQICQARKKRALAIIEKLKAQGIDLDSERLLTLDAIGSVGRLHIARMLHSQGIVQTIQEAFNKYLGNGRPCYVKKLKLTPEEAINMIHKLKGLAVLAHPYHIADENIIHKMVQLGLRGIEAYYPEHNSAATEHYQNLAKQYGLLITGGSDFHGLVKGKVMLGEVKIPYSLVEELKKEAEALTGG